VNVVKSSMLFPAKKVNLVVEDDLEAGVFLEKTVLMDLEDLLVELDLPDLPDLLDHGVTRDKWVSVSKEQEEKRVNPAHLERREAELEEPALRLENQKFTLDQKETKEFREERVNPVRKVNMVSQD